MKKDYLNLQNTERRTREVEKIEYIVDVDLEDNKPLKTERNILIAFILNLAFSIFEFIGGIVTGSVAIISDAIHDIGDATSVGISYLLERKSKNKPDEKYTYGYLRYSVVGGLITTLILLIGSVIVIFNAINRIMNPVTINYDGMIIFGIFGVVVNFLAAYFTHGGGSINQRAVNLHMLEDVLGWVIVLIGAIVMRFTDLYILDPIMSIGVAVFIFISAIRNLREVFDLFLEKIPSGISIKEIKDSVLKIDGVIDVHHIHIWSMDGENNYATMHIVTKSTNISMKEKIRKVLSENGISHTTLELEREGEKCYSKECDTKIKKCSCGHNH